ncbi:acyl-CoA dehydrogenase family protein [Allorhizobium terrae]|uniref:Acyl-CoA dehydrogenase C-terminal domain-containing protein n=1 Tax=Allorhizobium terrae TaxID=1848972 RepID=A0A4S4A7U9_9HYPH|nr:acyl-CoA dehydrogenase family protein [Allorhizobium terrae]THF54056.1 hypothetical protein E6C51_02900 [Allorhizobium terrae]
MHNVFRLSDQRLPDQRQQSAAQLSTEVEALNAARDIVGRIRATLNDADGDKRQLFKVLSSVSRSGLLGISVPSDHCGADIANAILAEVIALVAESAVELGECLKSHFQVIEALRLFASQGQHSVYFSHALAGEQFALASYGEPEHHEPSTWPHLTADRTGFRLPPSTVSIAGGFWDWIAVPAIDPKGQHVLTLLARDTEGLAFRPVVDSLPQDQQPDVWMDIADIHIPADNLIPLTIGSLELSIWASLSHLLNSSIDLGIAKSAFADVCEHHRKAKGEDMSARVIVGQLAARIEGASAMLERAGQKLDIAQVSASADSALQASLSANTAAILAKDAAIAAKTTLAGISKSRGGDLTSRHTTQTQAETYPLNDEIHQLNSVELGGFHIDEKPPSAWPFGSR